MRPKRVSERGALKAQKRGNAASRASVLESLSPLLAAADFDLIGLAVNAGPPTQSIPKNTPTIIQTAVQVPPGGDASQLIAGLNPNYRVRGELTGPSLSAPLVVEAPIGQPLSIPPLPNAGDHIVQNLRVIDTGVAGEPVVTSVTPDACSITVIDRLLITQVQVNELSYDQIAQAGIKLTDDSFTAFNFTLALATTSGSQSFSIPVAFPSVGASDPNPVIGDPTITGPGIDVPTVYPVMLALGDDSGGTGSGSAGASGRLPGFGGGVARFPGVVVFPGRVGFLHQFFEAIVIVANGAPNGAPLVLTHLKAKANLPDNGTAADTSDDPLRIAETQTGGRVSELELRGLGDDGKYGTVDDVINIAPGQAGQASFLLEGLKEGLHTVNFDLEGTLEGLPGGPLTVKGEVPGAVLVRDASFAVTFTHPSVVRAGQEYDLALTLYNSGSRDIQGAFAQLARNSISGAQLRAGDDGRRQFTGTVKRGEAATIKWRLRSDTTGAVTASYVKFGNDIGAGLNIVTGVGDRNVPLSPDSLILPDPVLKLPPNVVEAARALLGQAWSIANAPPGSLPAGVAPVRKQAVMDKAAELGVAGIRVDFGEPVTVSLDTLMRDWLGELQESPDPGFLDAERNTPSGYEWFDAIGRVFYERLTGPTPVMPSDLQREFADAEIPRSPLISALVTQPPGDAVAGARLLDTQGRGVGFGPAASKRAGDLQTAGSLRLGTTDPNTGASHNAGQLLFVSNPGMDQWTLELNGWQAGTVDISLVVPSTGRTYSQFVWSGVQVAQGGRYRVNFRPQNARTAPALEEFRDGAYRATTATASVSTLNQPAPRVVGAVQVTDDVVPGGDKYGRLVGLLFSKPMLKETAETAARYRIGGGLLKNSNPPEQVGLAVNITGATLNFGGRFVFLALDSPVGPYIQRDVTIAGLSDAQRVPLTPSPTLTEVAARVSPEGIPPGAYLTGRVLQADGTPVFKSPVIYWTQECPNFALALPPPLPRPVALRYTDADGRYEIDYVRAGDCAPLSVTATHPSTQSEKRLVSPVAYDGQHMNLDLVFLGRGNVEGAVTSGGRPVPRALVKVVPELDVVGSQVVQADDTGRYSVRNVPVGHVSVTAVGTGIVSNASGFNAGTIESAGKTATIDVSLQDVTGGVRGRVLHADASPAAGSLVVAYARIPGFPVYTGNGMTAVGFSYTDRDGTFIINGLPIGEIRLEVNDYLNALSVAQTLQLTQANREVSGVVITLPPGAAGAGGGGTINGTVVNDIGIAVPRASVSSAGRVVHADDEGRFSLRNMVAGIQVIRATDPATNISGAATAEVRDGETTEGVNVILTRPSTLQGIVSLVAEGTITPAPAAGIRVTTDGEHITLTDEQGRYTLQNVTPNKRLTLRFVDVSKGLVINTPVTLRPGDILTRDATFRPGQIHGRIFEPGGTTGTQSDLLIFTQRPDLEAGPDYGLITSDLPLTTQTARDGTFTINNLNPGKYRVSASTVFFPTLVSGGGLLAPGGNEECNLSLVNTLAGKIQGRVFEPDGTTPVGAGIRVTLGGGSLADATVRTDDSGHYEFGEVFSAGNYTLTASESSTGNANRVNISVEKNKDALADVRLLGRGRLRVRVVDGAGHPATSGSVTLDGSAFPNEHRFAEITPQSNGVVLFDDLPEGPYALSATQHGLGGRASANVPLGSVVETTIQLQASGTVTGRVLVPGGAGAVGLADVKLMLDGRLAGFTVTTDSAPDVGRFTFDEVPAGDFTLDVFDNRSGRVGRSAGRITSEGETTEVNVELLPMGTVRGRVTSNGNPVDHAVVQLAAEGSGLSPVYLSATTDPNGRYRFNGIPAGRFQVIVTNAPGRLTGSANGILSGTTEPLPDAVADITLEPSLTLVGTVFKHGGTEPVAGAPVSIRAGGRAFQTATREDGSYRLEFAPLGEVRVRAEAPAGFDRGEAVPATGTEPGSTLNVNVTFNGTGTIEGFALDHNGAALSSGRVTFVNEDWDAPVIINANVQPDGRYEIDGAPAGHFTLRLSVLNLVGTGTASGDLQANQTLDLPARLADAGRLTGRVKSESGASPIVGASIVVTLRRADNSTIRFYTHTDAQGAWAFDNIPLGTVSVVAYDAASTGVALANGFTLVSNGQTVDVGDMLLDNTPIRVVSTTPALGASNVATSTPLTINFSEAALPASVNTDTIHLLKDSTELPASVILSDDGRMATIKPANHLPDSSSFNIVVSTDVEDLTGHPPTGEFRASFTTADETAPSVLTLTPVHGASEVRVTTSIVATFDEALDRNQDLSRVLMLTSSDAPDAPVAATLSLDDAGKALTLTPANALGESKRYTVAIAGQRDAAGNAQATAATSSFITFNPPPAVTIVEPAEGAQLSENQRVDLVADATDNTAIAQLVFTANGIALPPVNAAPYRQSFTVPTGIDSLSIIASVTDDLGKTAVSPTRTVGVTSDQGATIGGLLTIGSSQPVAGVQVKMIASNGTFNTATDASGHYQFDNAGIGPVVVQANDPASHLRGRATTSVNSFAQTLNLNIRLSASGTVNGTVFQAGGTTPLAGAQVSLSSTFGTLVDATTTDAQGHYAFDFAPLGNFNVGATDPATGDRGRATNQLDADGETRAVNVTLNGLGRVVVTVLSSSNDPVGGAQVSVTSQPPFVSTQTAATLPDGTATFERVLAGSFSVNASDPVSHVGGMATGSVASGATASVNVRLQPSGTVSGHVFGVDGTTPTGGATVRLYTGNYFYYPVAQAASADDGSYRFDFIPLDTYSMDVLDAAGRVRARASSVKLTSNGQTVTQDFTFNGLGTVTGRVLNPDASVAGNIPVNVRSTNSVSGGYFTVTTDEQGLYSVGEVPVGRFTATAGDSSQSLQGEASGQIARDGETVTADIQLLDNSVSLPTYLFDGNSFFFDLQGDGSIDQGQSGVFSGNNQDNRGALLLDLIAGGSANRFAGSGVGTQDSDGRQVTIRQQNLAGLDVTRKVYVPRDGYFVRYLEIISNPTDSPLTVDVRVRSNLSGYTRSAPHIISTSSGDDTLSVADAATADRWVTLDDGYDNDPFESYYSPPAVAFAFDGPNGAERATSAVLNGIDDSYGQLDYQWSNVTIAPRATVAYMHFGVQQTSRAAARASVERLFQLPPEALAGLTQAEIGEIRNFAVPADGSSAVAPLPSLNGTVTGRVLASDAATAVPYGQVQLKSNNLLYGRTRSVYCDGTGAFTFTSFFSPYGGSVFIPADGFTLSATHPQSVIQSPLVAGTFAPGQTTATQDIIFSNTATVRGTVRTQAGQPVTAGSVQIQFLNFTRSAVGIGEDGSYVLTGVPAGRFSVTAFVNHPQGSPTARTISVTTVAGRVVTADITLPATGTVSGVVRDASGNAAGNRGLRLDSNTSFLFSRFTQTDASGQYTFVDVPVGSYTIQAFEPRTGRPSSAQVNVVPGQTSQQDLTLVGVGQVQIQVNYANGSPAFQSPVYFRGSYAGSTDAGGHLTVPSATLGDFEVLAYNPNNFRLYTIVTGNLATDGGTASVTVVLSGLGTVTGRVTFADGAPAADARVDLFGANVPSQSTQTNPDGTYNFNQVVAGRAFAVQVQDPRSPYLYRNIPDNTILNDGDTLTVNATLPALATLRLTVLKADGTPFAGAPVSLADSFRSYQRPVGNTDASGVLLIPDVPEGSFTATVNDPNTGAVRGSTQGSVALSDDGRTIDATINVPRATNIRGTIFAGDGQTPLAPASAYVEVVDAATEQVIAYGYTDYSTGRYEFDAIAPGAQGFKVRARSPFDESVAEATGQVVNDGDTIELNLTLPVSIVKGTVFYDDGSPLPYPNVYLMQTDAAGNPQSFYAYVKDEQGRYAIFGAAVGGFDITAQDSDTGLTTGLSGNVADVSAPVVVDIHLPPTGRVNGRVTAKDASGHLVGVAQARVSLMFEGNTFQRNATADDAGTYTFDRVQLGAFSVQAEHPSNGGFYGTAAGTLAAAGDTAIANITLPDTGGASGKVFGPDGLTPVPYAGVSLTSTAMTYGRSTSADANGVFHFTDIPLSALSLQARDFSTDPVGYGGASAVLANANEVASVNITLLLNRTVSGRVLKADGSPAANAFVTFRAFGGGGGNADGFFRYLRAGSDGSYEVTGVPLGLVRAVAHDPEDYDNIIGSAAATLTAAGLSNFDLTLGSALREPFNLEGADDFRYDIYSDGSLGSGGTNDNSLRSYDGAFSLLFNNAYLPAVEGITAEENGRQAVAGPVGMDDLSVTRKVFAPASGGFARYLEIISNPTGTDINVNVKAAVRLNSGDETRVVALPSANGNLYAVTDNRTGARTSALAFVFAGPGAAVGVNSAEFRNRSDYQSYNWNVTIPAGQTRILMHFAVQRGAADSAGAKSQAEALVNLSDPHALERMSAAERSQVVNFQIP
jgi:hypothetical protein